ncbi:hypothetical protein [Kaarinaea lacus]
MSNNKIINTGSSNSSKFSTNNNGGAATGELRVKALRDEPDGEAVMADSAAAAAQAKTGPQPEPGSDKVRKSLFPAIMYGLLMFTILIAGFFFIHHFTSPESDVNPASANSPSKASARPTFSPSRATINRPVDIKAIVSNLMNDKVWDVQKIHIFKKNWLQLGAEQQIKLSNEDWFAKFQAALAQQIEAPIEATSTNKQLIIVRSAALVELQEVLTTTTESRTIALAVTSDQSALATATSPQNDSPNRVEIEMAGAQQAVVVKTIKPEKDEKVKDAMAESAFIEVPAGEVERKPVESATSETPVAVSQQRENTEVTNPPTSGAAAKKAEQPLQQPAKDSSVGDEIASAKVAQPQQAERSTETLAVVEVAPTPVVVPVEIERRVNETKKQVETVKPKSTREKSVKKYFYVNGSLEGLSRGKNPEKVTVAELNDLTVQLSSFYESGDLEGFASLFSSNPVDAEQQALMHVKKQFETWLSGTTDRQMFLKELNWVFNKNIAIGTGKLTLTLISDSEPQVLTLKRNIELTVKKENQKVSITKFEQSDL